MNILLATPLYERPEADTVQSVEATRDALLARGDYVQPWRLIRAGLVHESRNIICRMFLESQCDVLVQIDHDHVWKAEDLIATIDFVGKSGLAHVCGFAHPYKRSWAKGMASPRFLKERPIPRVVYEGRAYLEVDVVGGGILVTSRRAIELSTEKARTLDDGSRAPFDIRAGYGEDVWFCREWRKLGGTIYCALEADIGHIGPFVYRADFPKELAAMEAKEAEIARVKAEKPLSRLRPPGDET